MATQTAVIGFPRIGRARELKFETERFFRGEGTAEALERAAAGIRAYGWQAQARAGIGFIPSNDFSFYDNVLDTAFLLGAVPERYAALGLPPLQTYFAAAHGYQGEAGDVKALPMKKWFNTNYHYIVPELSDGTALSLAADAKPLAEYAEARALGVQTVPHLVGAYTFLRLATYTGKKRAADFAAALADCYAELCARLSAAGAEWVSFDEPALVLDVTADERALFCTLYEALLSAVRARTGLKVAVQTYFGDVRDVYADLCALNLDGIGLDFVEGKRSAALVQSGFPRGALLFAGVVNGKNIWRTNYDKRLSLLSALEAAVGAERVVVGTSCSLLHVPYTTAAEQKLAADIKKHFAFAEEKLTELGELAATVATALAGGSAAHADATHAAAALAANRALFASERVYKTPAVQSALAALTQDDFVRKPAFAERERLQRDAFQLPPLPTTTIGSFPQTSDVRQNRAAFRKGAITREEYVAFNKKKIAACIRAQEALGLDVLVHGEFERNDMVEYFGSQLYGYIFTEQAWVQSYGTRCVKPPIVWSDVARRAPMTVDWAVYAQSLTKKPVKGMLTGPVTILNWSFPREDISLEEQAEQIALAIREEVLDLEKHGIRIIQIDEAALREKLPLRRADWHADYLDWAIPAFRLVHAKVRAETQIHTHMCYSEFGDIIRDIDAMDADVITFEASRADLTLLDALAAADFRTQVGPGVYDIHSARVPAVTEIAAALRTMLAKVPREKLWVNPDCGLKTRGERETEASLCNMVAAAQQVRAEATSV